MWWTDDGSYILSSHSDGSYCRWMVGGEDVNEEVEKSDIPYGEEEKLSTALSSAAVAKNVFFLLFCLLLQDISPARPFLK